MGKHEVGTPKYIANKMKAKGLQKLRWYCQMCQKQCRDENGFKCHTMSESHHRQLLLFADNQYKYMDQFSREFKQGYLHLLKRQFGTKRVSANRVYQEYIADKNHIHMNATNWLSLSGFVKYLGRSGACVVDETEKGWYITYIDRDPETIAAQEKKAKKNKMDLDDEERLMSFIEKQVKNGSSKVEETEELTPLIRPEDDAPLVLNMKLKPKVTPIPVLQSKFALSSKKVSNVTIKKEPISDTEDDVKSVRSEKESSSKRRKEEREHREDKYKNESGSSKRFKQHDKEEGKNKEQGWLRRGLIVKITTDTLGEKYHKAKGEICEVVDKTRFVGKVKLKSPQAVQGHIIKIDQEHLETVIPAIGREVLILSGRYEGLTARLESVRIEEFCADVELTDSRKLLKRMPYEHICKFVN